MNKVIENIETRRSCRKYKPELPPRETLEEIARAGTFAASGKGRQSATIVVITDRATRDQLSSMNAKILKTNGDPFYGAPCLMLVLAESSIPTYIADGSLVMGNLMLAAHSLGLGSCWINRAKEEFESPEGKELLKKWGLPETLAGIGHCVLGWPADETPRVAPRKPDYIRWIE
ncbi:MAG: nitroreductase family protein [Desulfovibrio sp.]|nr:nitroreductase family protein [Desulfovibrio sp.]